MSKLRFTSKDGAATFVDRDGNELVITSITFESVGTIGGGVDVLHRPAPEEDENHPVSPTPPPEPSLFDAGGSEAPDPIEDVWAHYVATMEPRDTALHQAERAVIRDALKVATPVELKRAITACRGSDFHMGRNERGRKYNRLSNIIKGKRGGRTTREQIDFFLDMLASDHLPSGLTSEGAAKVARLKDEVRRGVGQGEARRKLRDEYGIESEFVEREGRPGVWTFRDVR